MSAVGVVLSDCRLVWVDTDVPVAAFEPVLVYLPEGERDGIVVVATGQLLTSCPGTVGRLVARRSSTLEDHDCDDLPAADLPPLGATIDVAGTPGVVIAVDPVRRTVTISPGHGADPITCPWTE